MSTGTETLNGLQLWRVLTEVMVASFLTATVVDGLPAGLVYEFGTFLGTLLGWETNLAF
jgi:hypothetical protein